MWRMVFVIGLMMLFSGCNGQNHRYGKASLAFVNDGKIVLVSDHNQLIKTKIQGDEPVLSRDGAILACQILKIKEKVEIQNASYPNLGPTFDLSGIDLYDLVTGENRKILESGENPSFSPSGDRLVYTDNNLIKVINLSNNKIDEYGVGKYPVWLDDDTIIYSGDDYQNWRLSISKKTNGPIFQGEVIPPGHEKILSEEWIKAALAGKPSLAHTTPISVDNGVGFIESRLYIDNKSEICRQIDLVWMQANKIKKYPILILHQDVTHTYDDFAFDSKRGLIAFTEGSPDIEIHQPTKLCLKKISDISTSEKKIQTIAFIQDISGVCFNSQGQLLVASVDNHKTHIRSGDDEFYIIGALQLDPAQIKLMKLDPSLCDADSVYTINCHSGKKRLLSGGHSLVSR